MTTVPGQQPDERLTEPAGDGLSSTISMPPVGRRSRHVWRWLGWALAALVALFLLVQAVPYGRSHTNPPVTAEPRWDTPQTRALAARACFDCHSNLTKWPWYSTRIHRSGRWFRPILKEE